MKQTRRGKPGYSRNYYRLLFGTQDTPADIAERIAHREICECAHREMMERFAPLTTANATDAIRWQDARIAELTAARNERRTR